MKYFFTACIAFVVVALGLGLYFSGTPGSARAERLDELRVSNLSTIQSFVVSYYISNSHLPSKLGDVMALNVGPYYVDPETKILYEYQKKNDTQFRLCATFSRSNENGDVSYYPYGPQGYSYSVPSIEGIVGTVSWVHSSGHVCFDRTIDPKVIPPVSIPAVPIKS